MKAVQDGAEITLSLCAQEVQVCLRTNNLLDYGISVPSKVCCSIILSMTLVFVSQPNQSIDVACWQMQATPNYNEFLPLAYP